jgi:tRNA(adenine34) deaminase
MPSEIDGLDHEDYMREALKEATLALQHGERPIGAIVVHNGQIVGRGRAQHRERQSEIAHAELNALIQAERYLYRHTHECVIYTTVEPCVMCLGAIVMSDIDHVVYALPDRWIKPGEMLGMDYVRRHIKTYKGGVLEAESAALWEKSNPNELRMLQEGTR